MSNSAFSGLRSECLMCTFRASCCSTRLSRSQVPAFAGSPVRDRKCLVAIPDKHKCIFSRLVVYGVSKMNNSDILMYFVDSNHQERERYVLFYDALNTFYLRLYGVRHMVKDHSDSEKGNPLPPHRLRLSINSKGSFIYTIPQTG